ncbi:uncharacterized protein LOC124368262 [Homalodisca vitripennis]|uniref:uncharacterized protein LOC124368262 n=1 Tax=Homalodisca vitripennis TaxID=197043 RepID=UPI001EEB8487|nr:uncharacterized protein LOC124368262 [Homalodisca vitripennis]
MASTGCSTGGRRLLISDRVTGTKFLIDTGSDLCCYPRHLLQNRPQRVDYDLVAANSSQIHTYGFRNFGLNLGLRRIFAWKFIIADVTMPIIGSDFLAHYGILPHCRNQRLIDSTTNLTVRCQTSDASVPRVKTLTESSLFHAVLAEFPTLTRPAGTPREVKHNTLHFIKTTPGPPISC